MRRYYFQDEPRPRVKTRQAPKTKAEDYWDFVEFVEFRDEVKAKKKEENDKKKKDKEVAKRNFTALEWFLLAWLLYPVVGPIINAASKHLDKLSAAVTAVH